MPRSSEPKSSRYCEAASGAAMEEPGLLRTEFKIAEKLSYALASEPAADVRSALVEALTGTEGLSRVANASLSAALRYDVRDVRISVATALSRMTVFPFDSDRL